MRFQWSEINGTRQSASLRSPVFTSPIKHRTSNIKHAALAAQLTFVLSAVEVAVPFSDESVVIDLPMFVGADSNTFSSAAGSGVGSHSRPKELRSLFVVHDLVHRPDPVRTCCQTR